MSIVDDLEPLAVSWREKSIPILRRASAEWLLTIVAQHTPKRVLELGTAVGYSGSILSSSGAQLVTIDSDEKALATAEETFATFGVDAQIIAEDAVEALKDIVQLGLIPGDFDLVFIDHMKRQYAEAFEWCLKLARTGTIIIIDNISNPKCASFAAALQTDPRVSCTIVPVDEGVAYCVVK